MIESNELKEFCARWKEKAATICVDEAAWEKQFLVNHFDKFFTLYVVYNRLCLEASLLLVKGRILDQKKLGDKSNATQNLHLFLEKKGGIQAFKKDREFLSAIQGMRKILKEKQFYVVLKAPEYEANPTKDSELLDEFDSEEFSKRFLATLEFVYYIRCNMFHGSKNLSREQEPVLKPCIIVLEKLCNLIYQKLTYPQSL